MSFNRPVPARIPSAAFWKITGNEARLALRQPRGLILGLVLPLGLLMVMGGSAKFREPLAALGGLTRFDLYVPILLCFAVAAIALLSMPSPLATYREQGVLRRLSTTPVPPAWVLAAQFALNLCLVVVALGLLTLISTTVFGYAAHVALGAFLLTALLSICAMFAVGTLIGAIAPSGGASYVIGALAFFALMFFAGLWLPRASMSPTLADISNYTPLGASVQAFQTTLGGGVPPAWQLLVLAGYALVFAILSVRLFRWD
jgi:ABC-2 type transport system permease protein